MSCKKHIRVCMPKANWFFVCVKDGGRGLRKPTDTRCHVSGARTMMSRYKLSVAGGMAAFEAAAVAGNNILLFGVWLGQSHAHACCCAL